MMMHLAGVFDIKKNLNPANEQIFHFWQIASCGNVNLDESWKKIDFTQVVSCSVFEDNRERPNLRLVDVLTVNRNFETIEHMHDRLKLR